MAYVDGFLIPLPKKNLAEYRKQAALGGKVWMAHGALEYYECVADELTVPDDKGKMMSPFPKLTGLKKDETLVFSWILYRSKAHRNAVNKKVMKDPRMLTMMGKAMPFDMARFNMGGFRSIVAHAPVTRAQRARPRAVRPVRA